MTDEDRFPPDDAAAVVRHMNHEHTGDALLIVRAFGDLPEASGAVVKDLDKLGIVFDATVDDEHRSVRVPWSTRLEERPQLRPEITRLYRNACAELGVPARGDDQH